MIEMIMDKENMKFYATDNGIVFAELEADIYDDTAILHNEVFSFKKSYAKHLRSMLMDIGGILHEYGVSKMIAVSDSYCEKIGKYWRLMGFECFGRYNQDYIVINFAVMGC